MAHWRKFDQDDIKRFIAECEERKETIVRMKLENSTPNDLKITLEPQGSLDEFPAGTTYTLVASGSSRMYVHVKIQEEQFVVYCEYCWGAIFKADGSATDAI